jgi:hypothetical protein
VEEDSCHRLTAPENAVVVKSVQVLLGSGTPSITVNIEGARRSLILDTGSNVSILKPGVSGSDVGATPLKPYGVTGETLDIKGQQIVTLELGGRQFRHAFLVSPLPAEADGLLDTDFLEEADADINFENYELSLADTDREPRAHSDAFEECTALTIFTKGKEGRNPQPRQQVAWQKDEQIPASPCCEAPTPQNGTWLVKASENIILAPRCRQIVQGRLETEGEQSLPPFVVVETAQIPIEVIPPARSPEWSRAHTSLPKARRRVVPLPPDMLTVHMSR